MKNHIKRNAIIKKNGLRFFILLGMIATVFLGARFVLQAPFFTGDSEEQATEKEKITVESNTRRWIFDRNFKELAVSFKQSSVFAFPLQVKRPKETAEKFAEVLDLEYEEVLGSLSQKQNVVWLAQNVDQEVGKKIAGLNLPGINIREDEHRYYPNKYCAGHVIGYLKGKRGIAGVECFYDSMLHGGINGTFVEPQRRHEALYGKSGNDGHLVLTLDLRIQRLLEKKLVALQAATSATTAQVLVMGVNNGEILALANHPSIDPNRYWDFDASTRENRAVTNPIPIGLFAHLLGSASPTKENEGSEDNMSGGNWLQIAKGSYVSTVRTQSDFPGALEGNKKLTEKRFPLSGKANIDLPMHTAKRELKNSIKESRTDGLASATLLDIAAFLANQANNGKSVTPHLLAGVWNDADGEMYYHIPQSERSNDAAIKSGSQKALDSLMFHQGRNVKLLETFLHASVFDARELNDKDETEQSFGREIKKNQGFQTVLLGLMPVDDPEIAMVIVLNEADVDVARVSPMRQMSIQVAEKIIEWSREIPFVPEPNTLMARRPKLYANWQKGEEADKEDTAPEVVAVVASLPKKKAEQKIMPDLKGYSLRKALQELQQYQLQIKISGSGWVTGHIPDAGKPVAGQECLLKLSMGREDLIKSVIAQR